MFRQFMSPSVSAALAVALVGCGGTSADTASPAELSEADVIVVAEDSAYVDPPSELPGGTSVVALENQGDVPHDITIDANDETLVAADGGEVAAGEVTLETGSYTLYCSIPGHREAGMEFEVTVTS